MTSEQIGCPVPGTSAAGLRPPRATARAKSRTARRSVDGSIAWRRRSSSSQGRVTTIRWCIRWCIDWCIRWWIRQCLCCRSLALPGYRHLPYRTPALPLTCPTAHLPHRSPALPLTCPTAHLPYRSPAPPLTCPTLSTAHPDGKSSASSPEASPGPTYSASSASSQPSSKPPCAAGPIPTIRWMGWRWSWCHRRRGSTSRRWVRWRV